MPPSVEGSKEDLFGGGTAAKRKWVATSDAFCLPGVCVHPLSRCHGVCRRTADGFAIYSEAELRLEKHGGDTGLCPFDCECCF